MKFLLLFLISFNASAFLNKDWLLETNKGKVEGHEIVHKFGRNPSVGTSYAVLASATVYQTPTTLEALEVVSDSANDTAAGSGARTITIMGINDVNGSWTEDSETIILNGTTTVASTKTWRRIYRMNVATSGTYATSAGSSHSSTITVRAAGAGATWAMILSDGGFGLGSSEIGSFTIPKGKTGIIVSEHMYVDASKPASVLVYKRENTDTVSAPYSPMKVIQVLNNVSEHINVSTRSGLGKIVGPADVGYMAKLGSGSGAIGIEFEIVMYDTP